MNTPLNPFEEALNAVSRMKPTLVEPSDIGVDNEAYTDLRPEYLRKKWKQEQTTVFLPNGVSFSCARYYGDSEAFQIARLVASAPDLLEALDDLLGCFGGVTDITQAVQAARAVVEKAKLLR